MLKDILLVITYGLTALENALFIAYLERVLQRLTAWLAAQPEGQQPKKLAAQVSALSNAYAALDEAYLLSNKSALTTRIEATDAQRDDLLTAWREMLSAKQKIGSDEEKAAVETLQEIDKRYGVKTRMRYEEEGFKIAQMTQELLGSARLTKALQTVGLKATIEQLQTVNAECRDLVNLRNTERSAKDRGVMAAARETADAEYHLTISLLNGLAITDDDEQRYEQLIRQLNEDIWYYKNVVLSRGGSSEEEPTPAPEPEPEPEMGGENE